jgi:hypothetical protein
VSEGVHRFQNNRRHPFLRVLFYIYDIYINTVFLYCRYINNQLLLRMYGSCAQATENKDVKKRKLQNIS